MITENPTLTQVSDIQQLIDRHRPGWTLEQRFFIDSAVFELEMQKIFMHHWLFAGHVSQIPSRGDYFLYDIGGESTIIVRGDEGQVYALANVCRHRGSQVCTEATGHVSSLVCPYHNWVYRLDGTLQSARLMPEDFDKSGFGLHAAQVRIVEGLIFFCLGKEPPCLEPALHDILPHLEPYELARTKICFSADYDLHANWKILNENFRECYHCRSNHPELCRLMPHIALESPRALEEFEEWAAVSQERWQALGLTAPNVPVSAENRHHVIRFPFKKGYLSQTLDGQLAAPLLGRFRDPDVGILAGSILPTFWFEISVDYALLMRLTPVDSSLTRIHLDFLVRENTIEGVDYEVNRVTSFWKTTLEQDYKLCENSQAGVNSRYYQPGPYAPGITHRSSLGERGPAAFVEWYLRQLTYGQLQPKSRQHT
jgi:glycine betaine catabolism A